MRAHGGEVWVSRRRSLPSIKEGGKKQSDLDCFTHRLAADKDTEVEAAAGLFVGSSRCVALLFGHLHRYRQCPCSHRLIKPSRPLVRPAYLPLLQDARGIDAQVARSPVRSRQQRQNVRSCGPNGSTLPQPCIDESFLILAADTLPCFGNHRCYFLGFYVAGFK